MLAGIPFGFSCAIIMQGLTQYLMDTYSIYCASAIASTVVTRSIVAAVFPLISPALYSNLGDAWACSVFAFLAAACMPVPFLFYVSRMFPPWQAMLTVSAEIWTMGAEQIKMGVARQRTDPYRAAISCGR